MNMKILVNKAQCLICGEVLESLHTHDYKTCSCGNLSVDGGLDYCKRGVKDLSKWMDLSECGEKTIDDKALEIIKKKKPIPQAKKLMEEAWEVGESIIDFEHGYGSREHMVEEIGDVLFIIKQFILFYNITDEEISKVHEYKSERTLIEMEGGDASEQRRNRE